MENEEPKTIVHASKEIEELVAGGKVELINCDTINPIFHRYFPLGYLEQMLNDKKLAFVYPKLWNDPYETLYLTTDFSAVSKYRQKRIFCLCARSTDDNEEASWKVYSNGSEPLIRVRFHIVELLRQIIEFADRKKCKVYYSRILYDYDYDQIREIKYRQELRERFLEKIDEKKYVELMSLKRPSFGYEKEFRLFIVPTKDDVSPFKEDILKIPINMNVFERFTINPMERIREEDARRLATLTKKAQYESQAEMIECFIMSKVPHIKKLHRSVLYKNIDPIKDVSTEEKGKKEEKVNACPSQALTHSTDTNNNQKSN